MGGTLLLSQRFYSWLYYRSPSLSARLAKVSPKNAQIVGVSADDVNSHAEFCDSEGLKFPLLADTTGAVSKAYGSWMSFVSVRHSFIIDPNGVLRETFVKVNPATHSKEVFARLEELQKAA